MLIFLEHFYNIRYDTFLYIFSSSTTYQKTTAHTTSTLGNPSLKLNIFMALNGLEGEILNTINLLITLKMSKSHGLQVSS